MTKSEAVEMFDQKRVQMRRDEEAEHRASKSIVTAKDANDLLEEQAERRRIR